MSLKELGTAVILVEEGCLFLGDVKSPSSLAMIHLRPLANVWRDPTRLSVTVAAVKV